MRYVMIIVMVVLFLMILVDGPEPPYHSAFNAFVWVHQQNGVEPVWDDFPEVVKYLGNATYLVYDVKVTYHDEVWHLAR